MIGTLNKPTSQSWPGIRIKQVPRNRLPQIEDVPVMESETERLDSRRLDSRRLDSRYIYIYTINPYLLFLIFILLIMSFNPSYQVIVYRMLAET